MSLDNSCTAPDTLQQAQHFATSTLRKTVIESFRTRLLRLSFPLESRHCTPWAAGMARKRCHARDFFENFANSALWFLGSSRHRLSIQSVNVLCNVHLMFRFPGSIS